MCIFIFNFGKNAGSIFACLSECERICVTTNRVVHFSVHQLLLMHLFIFGLSVYEKSRQTLKSPHSSGFFSAIIIFYSVSRRRTIRTRPKAVKDRPFLRCRLSSYLVLPKASASKNRCFQDFRV